MTCIRATPQPRSGLAYAQFNLCEAAERGRLYDDAFRYGTLLTFNELIYRDRMPYTMHRHRLELPWPQLSPLHDSLQQIPQLSESRIKHFYVLTVPSVPASFMEEISCSKSSENYMFI